MDLQPHFFADLPLIFCQALGMLAHKFLKFCIYVFHHITALEKKSSDEEGFIKFIYSCWE